MNAAALAIPFRQLVERRLWPLAVLLVAALAAVPMLLASEPEVSVPSPIASASGATATASATEPIVSVAEPGGLESKRRVLGSRKDPFEPAVKAKAADTKATTPTVAGNNETKTSGGTGGTQVPAATAPGLAPKQTYELYSLTVRFGDSTAESLEAGNLKRLTALPSAEEPVVIYLGLKKDLKTAVFLVDSSATVQGDGRCVPTPSNCQTLELKAGETSFFDIAPAATGQTGSTTAGKQFQLDFVKVKRKKTTDAKAAARSRAAVAGGGRDALRARSSRVGGYRYDPKTGTVKRLSGKQLKAEAAARAARAAG